MVKRKIITPNIIDGGIAIPLGNNYYYMKGRKHVNGGIDIGPNNKNGLEVEDGEVMKLSPKEVKVYSSVPFLNGRSPVEKLLGGENPTTVFRQQEEYKDRNGINDDGTRKGKRKAAMGTNGNNTDNEDIAKEIVLPELNFVYSKKRNEPVGTYLNYTGEETITPTRNKYVNSKRDAIRINAVDAMLNTTNPTIPIVPNRGLISRIAGKLGVSDENRINIFGKKNNPYTCIATATSKFGDKYYISGNKTFYNNPEQYGFTEINKDIAKKGDLVQMISIDRNNPHHMTMITGEDKDILSYSDGGQSSKNIKLNQNISLFPYDNKKYYRFIGTKNDNDKWNKEYKEKYKKTMGGIENTNTLVKPKKPKILEQFNAFAPNQGLPTEAPAILTPETVGVMTTQKYLNAVTPKTKRDKFNADMEYRYSKQHPEYIKGTITNISNNTKADRVYMNDNTTAGSYDPNTNQITLNQNARTSRGAYQHELRHLLDYNLNQTDTNRVPRSLNRNEEQLLKNAYRFNEDIGTFKTTPNAFRIEAPAINTQLRHIISSDNGNATGEKLDNIIDNMDDNTLQEYYENLNGYTQGKKPKDYNDLKTALKNVAQNNNTPDLNKFVAKYGINMKRKYKTGGNIRLQANGKDRIVGFPSTGGLASVASGNLRHKARNGFSGLTKEEIAPLTQIQPNIPTTVEPIVNFDNNDPNFDANGTVSKRNNFWSNLGKGLGNFAINNTATLTGLGTNLVSNIMGYKANKNALNKMNYVYPEWKTMDYNADPVLSRPTSFKTNYSIGARLRELDEAQRQFEKDVDAATSSSQVAIARKQANRMNTLLDKNKLHEEKENKETELINADRKNRQDVVSKNADRLNKYLTDKANFTAAQLNAKQQYDTTQFLAKQAFNNSIIEKQAENKVGLMNNINSTIQNLLQNVQFGKQHSNDNFISLMKYPNIPVETLYAEGAITKSQMEQYKKLWGDVSKRK